MNNGYLKHYITYFSVSIFALSNNAISQKPADKFDLKRWKITLPIDADDDGRVDEISPRKLQRYSHPDFFYLDKNGHMVFTAPNQGSTTSGSPNARTELRQIIKGSKPKSRKANFAIKANTKSSRFGSVGGRMSATLKVDHVAVKAYYKKVYPAYSVVVGQVHAGKDRKLILEDQGFGWGNEPLKIFYKKWPKHKTGSVFWNYERNLGIGNLARTDIVYPVWGYTWENKDDPKDSGISLGEEFSYTVNIHENIMYLSFTSKEHPTVRYEINLANNIDAYGNIDEQDNPAGYSQDWMYFKAGAYNQCNSDKETGFWNPGCRGTGDWAKDLSRGNFARVTFSELTLGDSIAPEKLQKNTLAHE